VWKVRKFRHKSKVELTPWQAPGCGPDALAGPVGAESALTPKRGNTLARAQFYQSLLDSGKFENRSALARHLGVSRARVTQVLRWLRPPAAGDGDGQGSPEATT